MQRLGSRDWNTALLDTAPGGVSYLLLESSAGSAGVELMSHAQLSACHY